MRERPGGTATAEAAGGSGTSSGLSEGAGVSLGSCSLRSQSRPALTRGHSDPVHPSGLALPGIRPQAHSTLLGTQLGRHGWLGARESWLYAPCTSLGGAETGIPGSGRLPPPGYSSHLFSMSICTLWTRSRAIRRISWASCRSARSLKNLMMSVKSMLLSRIISR